MIKNNIKIKQYIPVNIQFISFKLTNLSKDLSLHKLQNNLL